MRMMYMCLNVAFLLVLVDVNDDYVYAPEEKRRKKLYDVCEKKK